ncbi:MAG: iron-containing alcohol dehydrogenase [Gammaproteobacteria bacterium]|nr:MAG: iron-containing alcohol dehydrogenase [Gammaproteobacteria bacterium]
MKSGADSNSTEPVNDQANWSYPTAIRFGAGRIAELADACASLGIARPLLVTDGGLAQTPMVRDAADACAQAGLGVAVFSDVRSNPVAQNVTDGLAALQAGDHDGVIAFGGGSALDVGKVVAFMSGQERPLWDFEDVGDQWQRADTDGILPIIAVPTTAGTGSEVGRAGVIGDPETHVKKVIFHPKMLPAVVISDPLLTVGLPADLTAWTGMDALAHCLEAYCARGFHPMADGIAVEGLRLIRNFLQRAVSDGSDIEARGAMLAAAAMGATAFQKGLGGVHALSHPLGALYDTHHGLSNAVFLPYVLAFNRPAIEPAMQRLAAWLGLPEPSFAAVADWILSLRAGFGIPHTLRELGIDDARSGQLATMAAADPTAAGNPVKLHAADCRRLYEASYTGKL